MSFLWQGGGQLHGHLNSRHDFQVFASLPEGWAFRRMILGYECHYTAELLTGEAEPVWNPVAVGVIWQIPPFQDTPPGSGLIDAGFHWSHWQGVNWTSAPLTAPAGNIQVTHDAPADGRTIDVQGARTADLSIVPSGSGLWVSIGNSTASGDGAPSQERTFWCAIQPRMLFEIPD